MSRRLSIMLTAAFLSATAGDIRAMPFAAPVTDSAPVILAQSIEDPPSEGPTGDPSPAGPTDGGPGAGVGPPSTAPWDDPFYRTVRNASRTFESRLNDCPEVPFDSVRQCLADALDNYANDLVNESEDLPPQAVEIEEIVARAGIAVRAAKTKRQAVAAVRTAISAVRKTITLLRADDQMVQTASTRAGGVVIASLQRADAKLERATGL